VALAGRYFVDFRARTAASYGHAFLWYGRLNEHGKVGVVEVAGLHPASDSVIPYILGHIIPVPSETGKSYGDLDEQYLTANARVAVVTASARNLPARMCSIDDGTLSKYTCTRPPKRSENIGGRYSCEAYDRIEIPEIKPDITSRCLAG
jgi:hypothetical protein